MGIASPVVFDLAGGRAAISIYVVSEVALFCVGVDRAIATVRATAITALRVAGPTILNLASRRTAVAVPGVSEIALFWGNHNTITTSGHTVRTAWVKAVGGASSAGSGAGASTAASRTRQTAKSRVKVLACGASDWRQDILHTYSLLVHVIARRTEARVGIWVIDSVEGASGATSLNHKLVGAADQLATAPDKLVATSALAGSVNCDLVERTPVAVARSINKLALLAGAHTLVVPKNETRRASALAIGISLTSRTNSTVAIEKETSRNARTVDAETVGSDPETRSTNALSIAQDLVGSAAGNTVLGRIDVSVSADLAHSVDSAKTFETAAGVSGSAEDFVST